MTKPNQEAFVGRVEYPNEDTLLERANAAISALKTGNASARDIALLLLWQRHPKRFAESDLEDAITRHSFTRKNAKVAIDRLRSMTDSDEAGHRLLHPGIQEAEALLGRAQEASSSKGVARRKKRRRRGVVKAPLPGVAPNS